MRPAARGRGQEPVPLSEAVAKRRTGYRAALAVPDFRRLVVALTVNSLGNWAYSVVLLVYVYERTHSAGWVAATSVLRFLPALVFSPYGGVVAERFERTRVLIGSSLTCFVLMAGLTIVVALRGPVALVVALAAATTACGTPYIPAVGALVPQLVTEDLLASANAIQSAIENVSTIVGPGVGALLLLTHRPSVTFGVNALTFLLAAAVISRIRARSTPTDVKEQGSSLVAQLVVGVRAIRDLPAARLPVLICALSTFLWGADSVLFVPISQHLHGGASGYGYLVAAQAAGGVAAIAVVNALSKRTSVTWAITLGMVMWCLPTALIPLFHHLAGGLVVQFVRGIGGIIVDVLALTALQRATPSNLLSRVLGIFATLSFASAALGSLVVPPLLHGLGLSTTLLVVSFGIFGISLLGIPGLRRIDERSRAAMHELQPTIDLLRRLDLLEGTDQAGLERLAKAAEKVEPAADSVVVREGERADAFYVLVTGEVVVTSHGESGQAVELRRLGPETYFGEIGLLHSIPRTATVTAAEDSVLLRISAEDFEAGVTSVAPSPALLATAGGRLGLTHPALASEVASVGAQA